MRLYIDLDLNRLVSRPGFTSAPRQEFARGDEGKMEVQMCRGTTLTQLAASAVLKFGMKPVGEYDADALVLLESFTEPGVANEPYEGYPSFNTVPLDALLVKDGDESNDVAYVDLNMEFTWSEDAGATWSTIRPATARIHNDVIRGDEGTPSSLPDPDAFVAAMAVLYDRAQSLSAAEKTQALENLGLPGLSNYSASVAPGVSDDSAAGYSVGSLWLDLVADTAWRCVDASVGAADWQETTLEASDLAAVAVSGNFSDLVGTLALAQIPDSEITLAKIADMATASFVGRSTAGAGVPEVLSAAAARTILNVEDGASADQTDAEILAAWVAESGRTVLQSIWWRPDITALTGGAANALDSIVTVGVPDGTLVKIDYNEGTVISYYLLTDGSAENSPAIIRPDDYGTSGKIWFRQSSQVYNLTAGGFLNVGDAGQIDGALLLGGPVHHGVSAVTSSASIYYDVEEVGMTPTLELDHNTTFQIPDGIAAGKAATMILEITQGTTGGTMAYASGITFAGGIVPVLSTATGAVDLLTLATFDGGITWRGTLAKGFA